MPTKINHEIISPKEHLPVYFNIYHSYNQFIPAHWHNHLELIYLASGTMYVTQNDEQYILSAGDLFVVNPNEIHTTRGQGHVDVTLLQVPFELIKHAITDGKDIVFMPYFHDSNFQSNPAFKSIIEDLRAMSSLYSGHSSGYGLAFTSHLYHLLYVLYTNFSKHQIIEEKNKAMKNLQRLSEIVTYVDNHFTEPITLSQLSNMVALSPEYLCRLFKESMSCTLLEYINQVRLTHIHQDLLTTQETITALQEKYGFTNYKVFNRMFKDAYGTTPSTFRKQVGKN